MHLVTRSLLSLGACVVLGACVSLSGGSTPSPSNAAVSSASGVPAAFTFNSGNDAPAPSGAPATCRSPALDPRDGTRLVLARSGGGRGDYEVPAGRYGVSGRQYLRLDCATGAVVGVVRR